MSNDVISLLQGVKEAETEKAAQIEAAKADAIARLRQARAAASGMEADVRRRIAEAEPKLRAEIEADVRRGMQALETWHAERLAALRETAKAKTDAAFEALRTRFLAEWKTE